MGRCSRLYPGASVSVRAAELLDGDGEVEIGELGRGRMSGDDRADTERHLRAAVGETIARFHRRAGRVPGRGASVRVTEGGSK